MKIFFKKDDVIDYVILKEPPSDLSEYPEILWIDLFEPTKKEIKWLSETFNIEVPTKAEVEEIESSSRYWEEEGVIKINTYFLIEEKSVNEDLELRFLNNESITFIIKDKILITIRYKELSTFSEISNRLLVNSKPYKDGLYVLAEILSLRIDKDADSLEKLSKEITQLSKYAIAGVDITEQVIETISFYEENNMTIRENLIDKQRVLSSLLKSYQIPPELKEEFRIMIKDVASLINYTSFNFDKLTYLQNTFLGLINLKQNRIIKVLTIISVLFAPATLVASIFGMNFKIPLGDSYLGFWFGLFMIFLAMVFAGLYFRNLK